MTHKKLVAKAKWLWEDADILLQMAETKADIKEINTMASQIESEAKELREKTTPARKKLVFGTVEEYVL